MIERVLLGLIGRDRLWRLGRRLYMAARDEVGNDMATNGEARLIADALAAAALEPPFVAYDVGANLGLWSRTLLGAAGSRPVRIEMFEPVPTCFETLAQAFASEPRAHANQAAISDRCGSAAMHVVSAHGGTNSLGGEAAPDAATVDVPLVTLGVHMAERGISRIDLLKIDAEGHDIVILRALAALLAADTIGIVQFEYNWRWIANRGTLREVFDLIAGTRYSVARVAPGGLLVYDAWNAELDRFFEGNYALIRDDLIGPIGAAPVRWSAGNVAVPA